MDQRTRLKIFAGVLGVVMLGLIAVGAPEVRDAVSSDGVDVVLSEPGEYQQPVDGAPTTELKDLFPVAEIYDVNGQVVMSDTFLDGTPLVVNLWFANCPPCQREMPDFAQADAQTGDAVRFIGVNPVDSVERMTEFASSVGVTYELYSDPYAALTNALDTIAFPLTVFVDADGRIVDRQGVLDAAGLAERLETLFGITASGAA
jgi:thiol-disulfide isomerase/thioredoxin